MVSSSGITNYSVYLSSCTIFIAVSAPIEFFERQFNDIVGLLGNEQLLVRCQNDDAFTFKVAIIRNKLERLAFA
jgi:hypothetical protein